METRQAFEPCAAYPLRSGATLRISVQSGSRLFVRHGRVVFRTPPTWLADTMLAPSLRLDAEQTALIEIAGWLEISALEDAEVLLALPPAEEGYVAKVIKILQGKLRDFCSRPTDARQLRCVPDRE